jgi:hypothetical protein
MSQPTRLRSGNHGGEKRKLPPGDDGAGIGVGAKPFGRPLLVDAGADQAGFHIDAEGHAALLHIVDRA